MRTPTILYHNQIKVIIKVPFNKKSLVGETVIQKTNSIMILKPSINNKLLIIPKNSYQINRNKQ